MFDGVDLIPSYAGPEPGLPGIDRIEIPLPNSLAEDIAGKEKDIVIQATINGETVSSQTGATIAFQEVVTDESELKGRTRQPALPPRKAPARVTIQIGLSQRKTDSGTDQTNRRSLRRKMDLAR